MYPEVRLLDHMVSILNFHRNPALFFIGVVPFYILTKGVQVYTMCMSLHLCQDLSFFKNYSHTNRCEVIAHCNFDLYFLDS